MMSEGAGRRRLDPSRGREPPASDAWQVPQPRLEEARFSAAGMDPERLAKITSRMQAFVQEGAIAGAVILLARHGEVALVEAVGYQDLDSKKPMRPDTICNIGSMTKTFTAVGIMILMEEGLLTLSDPVERHLPEFRDQLMVDRREGDKPPTLKVPPRPITIYDLLTHTSGMPGGFIPLSEQEKQTRANRDKTLAEVVAALPGKALEFASGTKFHYSSAGFWVLGRIIEVASGEPYEKFLEERIFRPLGMKDTFYYPPAEKYHRIASMYSLENGELKKRDDFDYRKRAKFVSPSGGWLSSDLELFAFYQMLLNGGTYNGVRILSRASVEVMTALHTGDLDTFSPGLGRGLGLWVVREPLGTLELLSIGSYGHGGFFGTVGWVDPKKDLVGLFLSQRTIHEGPGHGPERRHFMAMAAAAIAD